MVLRALLFLSLAACNGAVQIGESTTFSGFRAHTEHVDCSGISGGAEATVPVPDGAMTGITYCTAEDDCHVGQPARIRDGALHLSCTGYATADILIWEPVEVTVDTVEP